MSIRMARKVFLEVGRQGSESLLLAFDQPGSGSPARRQGGWEINAPDSKPGFDGRRRRGFHGDFGATNGGATPPIVDEASYRVPGRCYAAGVEFNLRARSDDPSAVRLPGVGKWIVVGIAGRCSDMDSVARMNRAWSR